jgi:hypothetical protein
MGRAVDPPWDPIAERVAGLNRERMPDSLRSGHGFEDLWLVE